MTTATQLADYVRCAHRVVLDRTGDPAKKLAPSPFLQLLWEGGRLHEDAVIAGLSGVEVPAGTASERLETTIRLMEQGVPSIYHGLLQANDLYGEPDLLVRSSRFVSRYGAYAYLPVDVKNGGAFSDRAKTKPKTAYAVQLCVYAELLMTAQGVLPLIGQIIDKDGVEQTYDLEAFWPEYERIRAEYDDVLNGRRSTQPGWKPACGACAWQKHCWDELVRADDVTTVDGVGESYRERLWQIGIHTATQLAAADPATLTVAKGIKVARAKAWTTKARVQKDGNPLFIGTWAPPEVDFEVSYDVEDFAFGSFVYLHGLLVRRSGASRYGSEGFTLGDFGSFEPVCAEAGESEEDVWKRFLASIEELERRGRYVVYVFTHHEKGMLKRLAKAYGGTPALESFVQRFVDLDRVVKRTVIFPTDSSNLKTLARYIGFDWRDDDPGGAQSLAWWNDYLRDPTGNAALRDRVIAYNEDDVRASFVLHDWLEHALAGRV